MLRVGVLVSGPGVGRVWDGFWLGLGHVWVGLGPGLALVQAGSGPGGSAELAKQVKALVEHSVVMPVGARQLVCPLGSVTNATSPNRRHRGHA